MFLRFVFFVFYFIFYTLEPMYTPLIVAGMGEDDTARMRKKTKKIATETLWSSGRPCSITEVKKEES